MTSFPRIPSRINKKIGQAMHDYAMFEDGDRVLVAVSGGVDSLVLGCLLHMWQKKAPVSFSIQGLHIDHGFWQDMDETISPDISIGQQLARYSVALRVEKEWQEKDQERTCYLCSRNRRSLLFDFAADNGYTKIALGHHKDDLIETFMINAMYSGNISTMLPKQSLFNNSLFLVRPMAYLEKREVQELASIFALNPIKNGCHLSHNTKRETVRAMLETLYLTEPEIKNSLFASLSNVRGDYLL